jgi:hypothetical protein
VAAGFARDRFHGNRVTLIEKDPATVKVEEGVPGRGDVKLRWIVVGSGKVTITYDAEKGGSVSGEVELR